MKISNDEIKTYKVRSGLVMRLPRLVQINYGAEPKFRMELLADRIVLHLINENENEINNNNNNR